jgi:hypothetical protein
MINGRSLVALLFLVGCNADHSIGQIDRDAGTDLATSEVASLAPPTAAHGGVDAGGVATPGASQSWSGYVENYKFPSGSDAVRLTFSADSAGQVTGNRPLPRIRVSGIRATTRPLIPILERKAFPTRLSAGR